MCMMGLFVLLWVLKPSPSPNTGSMPPNDDEFVKVAAAVREAFGYEPDPNKVDDRVNTYMLLKKLHPMRPHNGPGEGGETLQKPDGAEGREHEVTSIRPGQQAIVGGRLGFDAGSTAITPALKTQLEGVAKLIRGHRNIVLIKGHTSLDDLPETATAEAKMDLSLRRAQTVADVLVGLGVEPDIIRVQGCSTFEPVIQRAYTDPNRAVNRRVEIEATSTLVRDRQDVSMNDVPAPRSESAHAH